MTATLQMDEAPASMHSPLPATPPRGSKAPLVLLVLFVVVGGGWALRAWLFGRTHVRTDNAQVDGHITPVAPKVGGFVLRVLAEENQPVREGDTLVVLDTRDARARLLQAQADLALARSMAGSNRRAGQMQAQLAASRANAASAQAIVLSAEASVRKAEADLERARRLAATRVVSAQQLDAAEAAYAVASAQAEAARRQAGAAGSQVTASMAALQGADARLAAAEAAVETAQLQVGYTTIVAPSGGIVADLPSKLMAQGTGMFNLSRQLGGSFGIAITATLLTRYTEQARDALRPHLGVTEMLPRQWMAGLEQVFLREGGTQAEAALKARAALEGLVHQQASVIAFEKTFLTMGLVFLLGLPLLLFFRTGKAAAGAGAAH